MLERLLVPDGRANVASNSTGFTDAWQPELAVRARETGLDDVQRASMSRSARPVAGADACVGDAVTVLARALSASAPRRREAE